ncbi:MAG: hypothetical protein IPP71_07980 [Bacteroidetes bacterium]|nr:hypothetical protein [Bacteroidota bacterium]
MSAKITIIDCLFYASLYEGKCLSKKVSSRYDILEWRCSQGHRWETSYYNVQAGLWCPQCSKNEIKLQYLEKYKQIAESHGGGMFIGYLCKQID